MGNFAAAAQEAATKLCVIGRALPAVIEDLEDEMAFCNLLAARKWRILIGLLQTGNEKSFRAHADASCVCPEGTLGRGII